MLEVKGARANCWLRGEAEKRGRDGNTLPYHLQAPAAQASGTFESCVFKLLSKWIDTFRFEDENDYEYEIWFKFFSRIAKK